MEVRYKREVNHNYMILDAPSEGGGYECRMLASNTIEGLLRFRVRQYEDKREFYYEITSRQPLNRLLEQRKINGGEIRSILLSLSRVLSKIEEYLLKEEQILLEPEFIYIDPDRFTVSLCLLPGYSCDFPAALSELLRFLLEKINHKDREGVVMAYNLYHESLRENYGMSDLLRHLRETEDVIFKRRDDSRDESREQHKTEDEFRTYIPEENKAIDGIGSVRPIYEHVGKEDSKEHFTEEKYTGRIKAAAATAKITKTLQCFLMFLAMEGGIWYFTGREGISRYGLPAAVAAGAAAAVRLLQLRMSGGKKYKKEPAAGPVDITAAPEFKYGKTENVLNPVIKEESWRFQPESVTEYRQRKAEEDRQEELHAQENGTALLTQDEDMNRFPLFESINREEENIEITYVPFVIGKHPELADFCIRHSTVSRLHLRVDKREGVYIITDLNSTNGTSVGGYKLQANETVSIQNRDVITVADLKYYFIETYEG